MSSEHEGGAGMPRLLRSGFVPYAVMALASVSLSTARVAAQQVALADRAPRFWRAGDGPERVVEIDAATVPTFQRRISLTLEHATLGQALAIVERDADLRLVYSRDVVDLNRIVRLKAEDITVAGALTDLLLGAGVDVVLSRTGGVTLVPKKLPPPAGTVVGRVTDARTGHGVPGARVSLQGASLGTVTNDSGGFRIADLPAGRHTLTVRRIGYVQGTQAITVAADQEAAVDVRLEVSASPLDAVVVTGTVSAAEQKELSSPITVVTAADIERRGIEKVNDLFRGEIPGVFAADYGASNHYYGAPVYVRGTTELFNAPALKTYVDAIELANSQYLNEIDPAMIDHVEII